MGVAAFVFAVEWLLASEMVAIFATVIFIGNSLTVGAIALYGIVRVLRWAMDARVPMCERGRLAGGIAFLLLIQIPALLAVWLLILILGN